MVSGTAGALSDLRNRRRALTFPLMTIPPARQLEETRILLPAVIQHNERLVRERLWTKLRRLAGRLPFAEDLAAAYYCALDPRTPTRVRAVLLAAGAYFVLPVDMIPDFLVGFGFSDDATVLATAIGIVAGHIKDRHRDKARAALLRDVPPPDV